MRSITIACLVLLILSLTGLVNVNSQTCQGISQYGQCSSNSGCGCLHLSFADDVGICALIGVSCSRLSPCQTENDICEQPQHICVRHPRCNSSPLCYPLSMVDQRLCPPSVTTVIPTTTGFPSTIMPTTARPMTVTEGLMTSMETTGFPSTTMTTTARPMTVTEGLMTSMETTGFETAPSEIDFISNYSSVLTVYSERYSRIANFIYENSTEGNFTDGNFTVANFSANHYFEAIEIHVNTAGYYNFQSSSNMDTYGYLYQSEFDPFDPSKNLLVQDDDSASNGQFSFSAFLQPGVSYILVFTTFQEGQTGSFSVIATGPDSVDFLRINTVQTTMMTSTSTTSPNSVTSYYSNVLSTYDDTYPETNKFYQTIEILVNTSGLYDIISSSQMDTYGYLYQGSFYPSNPSVNLITHNDDNGGSNQFKLTAYLQAGVPYTLIFTTFGQAAVTGPFSLVATGPDSMNFTPMNTLQTSTSTSGTVNGSEYSSALTINSGNYSRDANSSSNYYYEAIQVIVNTTGSYTFSSKSNIDTYGYIYQENFYPSDPTFNLLDADDQNGGNDQFQFTVSLQEDRRYILVVTTYLEDITGPFSIDVSGPDSVELISSDNQ